MFKINNINNINQNPRNPPDNIHNQTTFVSIISDKWSNEMEKYIEFWGSCEIPLYLYVCEESFNEINHFLSTTYRNIKIHPEFYHYENTWAYQQSRLYQPDEIILPKYRNTNKDTNHFLWNGHAKVEYIAKTIEQNPFGSLYYAWIDINMPSTFRKDPSFIRDYLNENYSNFTSILNPPLFIPGCISTKFSDEKESKEYYKIYDHVNWRFCGSFFIGSVSAMIEFWELYNLFFIDFLQEKQILTWEVNFWAWLEKNACIDMDLNKKWNICWYYSDHCETVFQLPNDPHLCILQKSRSYASNYYDYCSVKQYRPTSAAYVYYNGRHWLNTRFVNYFVTPTGHYTYPDSIDHTIRNKNICSELSTREPGVSNMGSFYPITFLEMETNTHCLGVPFQHGFTEGIEDIRLYVFKNEIRFVGTTLSYSNEKDKLRIIRGTYDISMGTLSNGCVISPPTDTYCEKNWIPLIDETEQKEYFIYKWCPMEIGRVIENKTKSLEIIYSFQTNPFIFSKIRGSTLFIPFLYLEIECLIGVVHYSEETVPRQYYHRLVLLDKNTFNPIAYSNSFCFEKIGIEFCIGFTILEKQSVLNPKFVFWISQMDRDAMMVEIDIDFFNDKWHTIKQTKMKDEIHFL